MDLPSLLADIYEGGVNFLIYPFGKNHTKCKIVSFNKHLFLRLHYMNICAYIYVCVYMFVFAYTSAVPVGNMYSNRKVGG